MSPFEVVVRTSEAGTMIQLREALEGLMIPATTNHIIKWAMLDQHTRGRVASGPHRQDEKTVPQNKPLSCRRDHHRSSTEYYDSNRLTKADQIYLQRM